MIKLLLIRAKIKIYTFTRNTIIILMTGRSHVRWVPCKQAKAPSVWGWRRRRPDMKGSIYW
jgi:hypothetical protein